MDGDNTDNTCPTIAGTYGLSHGNAVMSVARPFDNGGEVVVCGTTDWVFGLDDPRVARVTANVLDRYLD